MGILIFKYLIMISKFWKRPIRMFTKLNNRIEIEKLVTKNFIQE